jgi:hypothetical protein
MMNSGVDEEAQISLDFLVAVVIFALTITFLLQTLTGLFIPFQSSSDELQSLAERVSAELVEDTGELSLISDINHPNVINRTKIETLNESFGDTNEEYVDAKSRLGLIGDWDNDINISLRNFNDALYKEVGDSKPLLQVGPPIPEYQNVAQSKRVVLYNTTHYLTLVVRVW